MRAGVLRFASGLHLLPSGQGLELKLVKSHNLAEWLVD
jgi:hypothetical protein